MLEGDIYIEVDLNVCNIFSEDDDGYGSVFDVGFSVFIFISSSVWDYNFENNCCYYKF